MYKLMIVFPPMVDPMLDERWPRFLHHAERMPGLRREATCRIEQVLYGESSFSLIHELYFDSLAALQDGMASAPGQQAGRLLQQITNGRLTLILADHREDNLENIRKHWKRSEHDEETPDS